MRKATVWTNVHRETFSSRSGCGEVESGAPART
jgi:hypothetical protein